MESTTHYFSRVMFYKLQSSASFLYDMLIVVISCATVMKIVKNVWNICFVLYCLFVAKMERWESNLGKFPFVRLATILVCRDIPIGCRLPRDLPISNNTCLPICPYWMPSTTWLWISNNTCLPMHPYWMQCHTWCSD
jgi:hypothetical protein